MRMLPEGAQHFVADVVAVLIVDLLEVIEVQQDETVGLLRLRSAWAACSLRRLKLRRFGNPVR